MVDLFAGIFLACPGTVGGKGYVLYAMAPTFQCGGCITLDRLVPETHKMDKSDKHILDGQFTATFDSLVTESIDSWKVPGLSIAVIQDDEVCAKVRRILFSMNWANGG